MNDTSPETEARLGVLLAQRSGSERVLMACEMFALARALMVANIRAESPDLTATELRVKIFDRTYGQDLDVAVRDRIIARLQSS